MLFPLPLNLTSQRTHPHVLCFCVRSINSPSPYLAASNFPSPLTPSPPLPPLSKLPETNISADTRKYLKSCLHLYPRCHCLRESPPDHYVEPTLLFPTLDLADARVSFPSTKRSVSLPTHKPLWAAHCNRMPAKSKVRPLGAFAFRAHLSPFPRSTLPFA